MKAPLLVLVITSLFIAACGPQAPATIDSASVLATANALAATMSAETQAAIPPTPTSTPTPEPSPTPSPSSTPVSTEMSPTSESGSGDCLHPLDVGSAGPTHRTLIKNQTGGTINLSLTLTEPNAFGECGAISYPNLGKNSSVMAELPAGNWFAYAWAALPKENFTVVGSFYVQPAQFDKLELCVRQAVIIYKQTC